MNIVTITMPMPAGIGPVNCFLLNMEADDTFILIDTGCYKGRDYLCNELKRHGCTPEKENLKHYPEGVVLADDKGRVVFSNRKVFGLFGRTEEELVGSQIHDLWSPLHRMTYNQAVNATLKDRKASSNIEIVGLHKNKSTFGIRVTVQSVKNKTKSYVGSRKLVAAIVTPIGSHNRGLLESAVSRLGAGVGIGGGDGQHTESSDSEEQFWLTKSLGNTTRAIISTLSGEVTYVSSMAEKLLSVSNSAVVGDTVAHLVQKSTIVEVGRKKVAKLVESALTTPGRPQVADIQLKKADSDTIVDVRVSVNTVSSGTERRIVIQLESVAETRALMRSMMKNQSLVSTMVESYDPDTPVFVMNEVGSVFMTNDSAAGIIGGDKDMLIGVPMSQLCSLSMSDVPNMEPGVWTRSVMKTVSGDRIPVQIKVSLAQYETEGENSTCYVILFAKKLASTNHLVVSGSESVQFHQV